MPSNTNITIKPQSCQHPKTIVATFKGELCRAYRLCSSPDQTKKEIEFLLNLFEDNGHDRRMLERLATDYTPPSTTTATNKNKNRKQNNKRTQQTDDNPTNLFDVLPFHGIDLSEEDEFKPFIVMPYLPDGKYHQMKRACDKAGVSLITKPGPKLKDVLCSTNKTRHDPAHKPGVYELRCPCSPNAVYVGQTIRPIATRAKEHERAAATGNWHHSGITQHKEHCNETVDYTPTVITNMSNKNKKKLTFDLKVRESLEIRRRNCGPGNGLNEDLGAYVKTTMWNPVFHQMDNG